ncbi:hypothetical protein MACH18_23090 [Phaeobacter italicus]|nr:hypothetical protein MACH18_23090 [Phaeobacter italicus]
MSGSEIDWPSTAAGTIGGMSIGGLHGVADEITPSGSPRIDVPFGAAVSIGLGVSTGSTLGQAVAESFLQLLKREKTRRRNYRTREDARRDVFEYIELFYNPKRKHTNNGMQSPVDFENRQLKLEKAGV